MRFVMSDYQKTLDEMSAYNTMAAHIKALGKIANSTHDTRLKSLIEVVAGMLAGYLKRPPTKINGKTISLPKTVPEPIISSKNRYFVALVNYCKQCIAQQEPSWMIEAKRNNWGPLPDSTTDENTE